MCAALGAGVYRTGGFWVSRGVDVFDVSPRDTLVMVWLCFGVSL